MAQKLSDRRLNLKKYEDQLLQLHARLQGEVQGLIDRVPETVNKPGMDSHLPTHLADQDAEGLDTELALLHNETDILHAVEAALDRIHDGSYGRCTNCGGEIVRERLDALPYTPLCIRCAERQTEE